jgi:hypothetical protein
LLAAFTTERMKNVEAATVATRIAPLPESAK